jgi:hypothetical protein
VQRTALRWTGADTLTLEIALQGRETVLPTVEVPGLEAVALPPVCLPYSPEFQPAESDRGLTTLEHLARATGGKERLEFAGVWIELPRHKRLMSVAPWLLLSAVVLFLLEILERRTGLLLRRRRLVRESVRQQRTKARWFSHSSQAPSAKPTKTTLDEQPLPSRDVLRESATNETAMVDALRKARERSRGRLE